MGAKEAAEKLEKSDETDEKRPSAAKADIQFTGFMRGLKPPPPSAWSFSAVCKPQPFVARGLMYGLKPVPFKTEASKEFFRD